jgi:tripartite-type tricarboxylate transporter receptor subunit TctC
MTNKVVARALAFSLLAIAASVQTNVASAQPEKFPSRPITLIVPFAAGGATDIVARLLAVHVSNDLGQPVVIDNRTGGAGNVGTLAAARAHPDGHTLVLATTTQLINQFLTKALPYNLFTDLVPVALIADAPEVVAISSKLPAKTLQQFAAAARTDPNNFSYGSPGVGSVPHLGAEVLAQAMNAKMVHVPFRGSADAVKEVASGSIEVTLATQASVASFADAGLIRIVAVAAANRLSTLPDVPTTTEAGFRGVELSNWFGIMAPRGTSPELVSRINESFNKAAALPDVRAALAKQGIEPVRQTPGQFAARLNDDGKTYQRLIEQVGLSPN